MPAAEEPLAFWFPPGEMETLPAWVGARAWFGIEPPASSTDPPTYIAVGRAEDGRLVCTALIVGRLSPDYGPFPHELTARSLREVSLPELLSTASQTAGFTDWTEWVGEILDNLPQSRPRIRKRQLDDAHFREVAEAYRAALVTSPESPTKWLAEHWQVAEPTLRRWLQRARDRGYLGPSTAGKAGEQQPPRKRSSKGGRRG